MTDITNEQILRDEAPGFRGADYNAVAKAAVLEDVRLLKLDFDVRPEIAADGVVLSYGRKLLSCDHDADSGIAAAIFRFHVKGRNGRKTAFAIEADYAAAYDVGSGAHPNAARAFVNNVGLFAAYPYFRALAAQMGWNAGLLLPPMPAISSTAYKTALQVPND